MTSEPFTAGTARSSSAALARDFIVSGDGLYAGGQIQSAFDAFQEAIRLQPDEADYHFRLASAAWKLDRKALVEAHYAQATRLDPSFAEAHKMLAQWFLNQGQTERALEPSARAAALAPNDADTVITHAVALNANGQPQRAWEILKPVVEAGQVSWHLASAYADLALKIDHVPQAVAMIERTLAEGKLPPVLARRLHVSAASLFEATGHYDEAFAQMSRAKKRVSERFDPIAYSQWVDYLIGYFTARKVRSLPRATHGSARPVLIVGMPRSGTSLVEQILASHPAVFGAGELRTLGRICQSVHAPAWSMGVGYPHCLDFLSVRQADALAAEYLGEIESLNAAAIYVTDKMPQNFENLGLAQALLPECRVIHCVRDARDTCLSCFLTDFDHGNAFSCDVNHLASYYRDYQRQMAHWKTVLTLPILDVRYEELVSDPQGQTRRLLDFLHLPWDAGCLRFHENKRSVVTASRDQVRRPLYSSSIGRWKRYEKNIAAWVDL